MKPISRSALVLAATALGAIPAAAQVPDVLNALDAGSRAMATGGANSVTNVDTFAAYYNPAALAFLDTRAADLAYRNLPESRTTFSGTRNDPDQSTEGKSGNSAISHAGYATPVRTLFGRGSGTLAFAYDLGGRVDDEGGANSLSDPPLTLQNYRLHRELKTDFYSISYGKALSASFSYGIGVVYATADASFDETGTYAAPTPPLDSHDSGTGSGVGAIVGGLYTPTSQPNFTFGLSYRTPISLSGGIDEYDEIPGRLIFGGTYRREGYRQGKDYLLLGAQVTDYFAGDSSTYFDRDGQTVFGFGAEYNVGIDAGRVPLRVGFTTVPKGGDGYTQRNAITFGFGLRPSRIPVGLDFSYAVPDGGGRDFSIAASYRFK